MFFHNLSTSTIINQYLYIIFLLLSFSSKDVNYYWHVTKG